MLYYENQFNLGNIYSECSEMFKEQRPEFLELLNKYIDINSYIPYSFKKAFYADTGRPRGCSLYGYVSALILQKIFNIPSDTLLILILNLSSEVRHFCGIDNVPDNSKWTRFKQNFADYLQEMFIALVDFTEPICQSIDPELATMLSYDTSAIESYVAENNPKYLNSTINKLKAYYNFKGIDKSNDDIYKQAFKTLPKSASSDSSIRKMYANGHFCYGRKFGILTNGLGIPRHIDFLDDDFKSRHKDFIYEDSDNPDFDKSVSDNKSLKPFLNDFYNLHPSFHHDIFLGDAAFDSYSTYDFLLKENDDGISLFKKAFIPLNSRATSDKPNCPINENGIPVCPNDHSILLKHAGRCHEKGRADRDKWICPKFIRLSVSSATCTCVNPCTNAKFGRTAYTTPSKNLRLYPGTIRGTDEWNKIYKIRCNVEQTINHIKQNMGIAGRKTRDAKTTKADVFLAGIAQLFTVIVADAMAKPQYIRSIKKLAC